MTERPSDELLEKLIGEMKFDYELCKTCIEQGMTTYRTPDGEQGSIQERMDEDKKMLDRFLHEADKRKIAKNMEKIKGAFNG